MTYALLNCLVEPWHTCCQDAGGTHGATMEYPNGEKPVMADQIKVQSKDWNNPRDEVITRECERINARLRHFRGIAVTVMGDAVEIWEEIWELLQDPRSCEEILDGHATARGGMAEGERSLFMEKFHLLGLYINYARKLCEGSFGSESQKEGEV